MIKKTFTQTQIIALGFFLMIAAGTLLLLCPFSSRTGNVPVLDALVYSHQCLLCDRAW